MTIGEDAILRRAEELGPSFRSAGSELLTDDDVATLTRLAGEGMGTLDCLQAVDLAFRLLLTGREALNGNNRASGRADHRWRRCGTIEGPIGHNRFAELGTVRNSVRWAMMMKRRESSHGYRERTSGPAPGWT
ncbi:hypothetical protein U8C31_29175 (plasmid) [Sinorhizobium medicae]|uniref:hypothetical protein n=1 Tax=Sinorhizobium medicae TaxID=110321 RepID=UPI002AF6B8FF|nr:hypothetical protein [Sinorhizobium medicae]WQO76157.1 hypothetical protein U8C31_29175 [Sinorhizobium medicae]